MGRVTTVGQMGRGCRGGNHIVGGGCQSTGNLTRGVRGQGRQTKNKGWSVLVCITSGTDAMTSWIQCCI